MTKVKEEQDTELLNELKRRVYTSDQSQGRIQISRFFSNR